MQKKADSISREKLLDMLRTVASDLGVTRLTLDKFDMYSGLARSVIYKHFDGWKDACQAAELTSGLTLAERPTPQTHTDDDCVRELQRVARLLKTASLSRSSFSQYARINASTVSRRFGNWHAALGAAGLCPTAIAGLEKQPTCDDCVGEVQRVAALLDQKHLTREEFRKHTKLKCDRILRTMGSWHNTLAAAGLAPSPEYKAEVQIEKLASDFLNTCIEIGDIPTLIQVTRRSDHADRTFAGKHGGYSNFKRLAIQHLFSSGARIPPAIKEAFSRELAHARKNNVVIQSNAPRVTKKVELGENEIVPLLATLLGDWHPAALRKELEYSNALASHLRAVLPDHVQVDREYRHEGTTCDIRIASRVDDEVFLELKWQLRKKAECDRLIGQVEGLKPRKNKIIVVLVGTTNETLLGRLKAHFNSHLVDQQAGKEKFKVICVPVI